ncbi:MAG: DUF362 domain-containing protein [Deltaproteobacteria bacterium]|nr:DUF362 domain-containing protein [Deltaproteobacteria bacterium]
MHRVMIEPAGYDECREAVDKAFNLFPLEIKNKKVLVKPNALRASEAEQGIVTHPAVVKAVVEKLEDLEAKEIVVGDNPGMMSYGSNEKTFKQTGLMDAAGDHYVNIGADAVEVEFNPMYLEKVSVSRAVLEADVVISVPKFKTHGLTVISGAVKNSYGFLPGALKANLHRLTGSRARFSDMLVDVYCLRVPDLVIVDGVVGMEGNGPASTELRDVGRILASDNGIAMDATIARIMGMDPARLLFLQIAKERGLGDFEEDAIEIIGDLSPVPDYKLPPSAHGSADAPTGGGAFFEGRMRLRPKSDSDTCTGCEICIDQCPVSALSMIDGLPLVNVELCIACFCCQEMCPEQAITLR